MYKKICIHICKKNEHNNDNPSIHSLFITPKQHAIYLKIIKHIKSKDTIQNKFYTIQIGRPEADHRDWLIHRLCYRCGNGLRSI